MIHVRKSIFKKNIKIYFRSEKITFETKTVFATKIYTEAKIIIFDSKDEFFSLIGKRQLSEGFFNLFRAVYIIY